MLQLSAIQSKAFCDWNITQGNCIHVTLGGYQNYTQKGKLIKLSYQTMHDTGSILLTMRTPKDHQSAACV